MLKNTWPFSAKLYDNANKYALQFDPNLLYTFFRWKPGSLTGVFTSVMQSQPLRMLAVNSSRPVPDHA